MTAAFPGLNLNPHTIQGVVHYQIAAIEQVDLAMK
jgi:hypothetical protein